MIDGNVIAFPERQAEQLFRRAVPAGYDSVQIRADDGIARKFYDAGKIEFINCDELKAGC